jgi:hypothetical protein
VSNSIVHHIPKPLVVFKQIARAAKPTAGLLIKDLLRPTTIRQWKKLVQTYAGDCNPYQQNLFADSLRAALSLREVQALARQARLQNVTIQQVSDRHWTLERKFEK